MEAGMTKLRKLGAIAVLALAGSGVQSESLRCPAAEQVALSASAPDWHSMSSQTYPLGAPVLRFESMRTDATVVVCIYRIEHSGIVRLRQTRTCERGGGDWKDQSNLLVCEADRAAACALECKP
jgi:hypothetical protein